VVRGWDDSDPARGIEIRQVRVREVLERTDWLQQLRVLASEGKLKLRVVTEYPPEEAGEAQTVMDAGGLRGRVLIVF
jgi:NADPH2:quinone reductase